MTGGYMNRILYVDLSTGRHWTEPLGEDLARKVIGGSGLGAFLLSRLTTAATDPLGPGNPLIFSVGPACGTKVPLSGRVVVVARSPQTGIYGEAESGNSFAPSLKAAGYDALVVLGEAPDPVYLWIDEAEVELRPAGHMWGRDAFVAHDMVRAETQPKAGVAVIGQAGENQVRMAGVIFDAPDGRTAARCGLGAVMGSKRLKAVACSGRRATPVAAPERLDAAVKAALPVVVQKTKRLKEFGSAGGTVTNAVLGDMGAKHWTIGDWTEGAEKIGGEAMAREMLTGRYYCPSCVVGCGRKVRLDEGEHAGEVAGGPEYETVAGFGAQMLIDDIRKVAALNDLCNRYGMDTISVSSTIAFALEAMDRGLLNRDADLPGGPVWANPGLVTALVHKIARRDGIGDLLSLGSRAVAERLGGEASRFAMHVKGLELAYHDPRALKSLAAGYATHPRGGCHRGCTHNAERYAFPALGIPKALDRLSDDDKGRVTAVMQNFAEVYQCLKICQFQMSAVEPEQVLEWFNAVTGFEFTLAELLEAGERVVNLKRLINLRFGVTAADDTIPARILEEAYPSGGAAGQVPDLVRQLQEYYSVRGWDREGRPTPGTLRRLGLHAEAETLLS